MGYFLHVSLVLLPDLDDWKSWTSWFWKLMEALRHSVLVEKCNVSLRKLQQQGISEPEFYGGLVYRIRKIVGKSHFSEQFRKLINRYKRIGYNPFIMRQTACQSWLMTMLHSWIARQWFGPQTQWRPLHKALTSGLGLDDLSVAWPAVVELVVSFNSGSQWILV